MKNSEKFVTAQERAEAFNRFCDSCFHCPLPEEIKEDKGYKCALAWLDLEAEEEKPLPCPFCGGRCATISQTTSIGIMYRVSCNFCSYTSMSYVIARDAIAAHNRVAKAVKEVKE